MTDEQRHEAMILQQALVQAHVGLGKRAMQLLAAIEAGQAELFPDLELVTARMEEMDQHIREGERLLGIVQPRTPPGLPN
jgi:Rad3-related DNA helicase